MNDHGISSAGPSVGSSVRMGFNAASHLAKVLSETRDMHVSKIVIAKAWVKRLSIDDKVARRIGVQVFLRRLQAADAVSQKAGQLGVRS